MRLNFSGTEISTAEPMLVGCVHHYSTHFINKLGKSLFFHKVQKTAIKGKQGPQRAKKGDFSKITGDEFTGEEFTWEIFQGGIFLAPD